MVQRIPVLVVSGFLGAGKTTLVRHLLEDAQQRGIRMAVISNELGALGIDRALLGGSEEVFVELAGGCVCCQLSDTLRDTLQMLRERVNPDCMVIETSGAALPFDTQLNLWREPVCHWVGDDMAVVVVNAEQLAEERDLDGTFEDQVSSADLLILNKVDLVSQATLTQITSQLHQYAPDTPCLTVVQGQLDPMVLFPPEFAEVRAQRRANPPTPPPHHHENFLAQQMDIEEGIDPNVLIARLRHLGVLRAKGFVKTSEGLRLVQGVGRRIELTEVGTPPPALFVGKIVVIGRR